MLHGGFSFLLFFEKTPIIASTTHRLIHIPSLYALLFVVAIFFFYMFFCLSPSV